MGSAHRKYSFENEAPRRCSSNNVKMVKIIQMPPSTPSESIPTNQDDTNEPVPPDGPMLGPTVASIEFWNPLFMKVENSVNDIKKKEFETLIGKIYENIRRRTWHADRNRADVGNFLLVRIGKNVRKVLRFFDFIPVPVDTVDGTENNWIASWPVRDQDEGISVDHLAAWAIQLEREDAKKLEINNCIDQHTFVRILKNYPRKDDNYITKDEFHTMMEQYMNNTDMDNLTRMKKLLHAIAYCEEFRWWPPPPFTIFIVLLEIVVFLYHTIFLYSSYGNYVSKTSEGPLTPLALCSQWLYHPHRKWEWWRFLTYGLVHNGPAHLITNLLVLCFIGLPLELTNKWWRVAIIYIFGILAGSLSVSILDSFVLLVGASGGVYALMGAHAANLVLNWKEDNAVMKQAFTKHRRTRAIKAKGIRKIRLALIITLALCDTAYSIYQRYFAFGRDKIKTSFLSHLSGAFCGLVVGIVVLKNRKAEYWEKILKGICLGLKLLMLAGAIYLNVTDVNSYRFSWFNTNGMVDNRAWNETLPLCQEALYNENKTLCNQLNWPTFGCFNKSICNQQGIGDMPFCKF